MRSIRPAVLLIAAVAMPTAAADLGAAKRNFFVSCSRCHGAAGKGDGPQADALKTKPRDFTDCARMKALSDETLFGAIKNGGEAVHLSKDMPAWKDSLDDEKIHDLVACVRSLCTK